MGLISVNDERLSARFWCKVDIRNEDECWEWIAYRNPLGYGNFHVRGRPAKAHRVAYELLVAPVPRGLVIDHLCRNPPCVNPAHLEVVSIGENVRRGNASQALLPYYAAMRARTHCKNGHEFSVENTSWLNGGKYRRCRTCNRERAAEHYRRQRAAA